MRTRFFNARILTMDGGTEVIRGELWVEGNRISYIGSTPTAMPEFDRETDVGGDLIMPGFKNAHTHSAMTFLRSYADDLPLMEWLNKQVFPLEARLGEEHVYAFSRLAVLEYLTSGITANFDMYYYNEAIAQASVDSGFRTVLQSAVSTFSGSCEQAEAEYRRLNRFHELISYRLGFHAEYTASDELLRELGELARREQAPVFVHNSETADEVRQCVARTGLTPTVRMDGFGLFDHGGGCYHCVYLSDEDIEIFKKRGIYAVTNPASNCKLASGIAPVTRLDDEGIVVAIGTDGAASNNCLDMFREMFLTTALQKLSGKDAAAMDAARVLRMAVTNGAYAMGLSDCDCLREGKLADLIILDLHQPNMRPLHNVAKNIVYSGSKGNVRMTMVNGKVLYEDGRFFVGVEPEELYEQVERLVRDICG